MKRLPALAVATFFAVALSSLPGARPSASAQPAFCRPTQEQMDACEQAPGVFATASASASRVKIIGPQATVYCRGPQII